MAIDAVETAAGRRHRDDPIAQRTGGPAGNAKLTAWTGLVLLVLFLAELVTLLDVRGLINWHIAIGAILIPPALLKTATTGWRIVRYYGGSAAYQDAGPPPLALRMLGPLVVLSTLAVLTTGVLLVLIGQSSSRQTVTSLLGQRVDLITLHQASFAVWAVATGLHTLGRTYPALRTTVLSDDHTRSRRVPGRLVRSCVLVAMAVLALLTAIYLLGAVGTGGSGSTGLSCAVVLPSAAQRVTARRTRHPSRGRPTESPDRGRAQRHPTSPDGP
jgi:hypothetical protein